MRKSKAWESKEEIVSLYKSGELKYDKLAEMYGTTLYTIYRILKDGNVKVKGRTGYAEPLEDRFWKYVNKTDSCWLWTGSANIYGDIFKIGVGKMLAHRASWEIHFGEIPDDIKVLHKCDVPLCVNPEHLFLGTTLDNIADKVSKGRQPRGENFSVSKLTNQKVLDIRKSHEDGLSYSQIMKLFGIPKTTVGNIIHRRTWKHV